MISAPETSIKKGKCDLHLLDKGVERARNRHRFKYKASKHIIHQKLRHATHRSAHIQSHAEANTNSDNLNTTRVKALSKIKLGHGVEAKECS